MDSKAIAQENRKLKDEVLALRSQLEELSKSPRSHPDPSPARDLLITEGLERVLCKSQLDTLCNFVADKCSQAVLSGKEIISPVPSLPSEAPGPSSGSGPSRIVSSQIGSTGKSFAKPSSGDILGSLLGDGSEDDLDDFTLDDQVG